MRFGAERFEYLVNLMMLPERNRLGSSWSLVANSPGRAVRKGLGIRFRVGVGIRFQIDVQVEPVVATGQIDVRQIGRAHV